MALNNPKEIYVHCSATPDDNDNITANDINEWHIERGFVSIGYHFVILKDGTVQEGRDVSLMGAHAYGHNRDSLAICLVGLYDFNRAQIKSLVDLLYDLMVKYDIHTTNLKSHYEVNENKTCPNIPGEVLRGLMQAELANRKGDGLPFGAS